MNEPVPSSRAASLRAQDRRSTLVVHAAFWSVLLADIALKYLLYFGPLATGPGFTARHVGATVSHFLIWLLAYVLCLNSSRRPLMGLVAAPTLFLGILVVPLLGWAGILALYLLRRSERRRNALSNHPQGLAPSAAPVPSPAPCTYLSLTIPAEQTLPVDESGCLVIEPGPLQCRFQMAFRPDRARTDEVDVMICATLLADREGQVWECRTYLLPHLFTAPVEAGAAAPSSGLVRWSDAPAAWKQACQEYPLLQGIRNLLDSRDCYILNVGGTTYRFRQKYQGPAIDVAGSAGPDPSLIVRISGLYHEVCLWGDHMSVEELPPFAYEMPWSDLLPITAPRWHYRQWGEWCRIEDEQQKLPLTFQRTGSRAAPQPRVRFCSDPAANREP
jgi:hypothetical protein